MTSELLVLPCINRNFPRVVSLSLSGILAYGCRFNICFLDARRNPPLAFDSKFIYNAHNGKIVALSFCTCENSELIASLGDDCQIKVWDIATQTCVNSREIKENIHVIEWMYGSSNTLVFPSDTRSISKWNFTANKISRVRTESEMNVTTMVSCKNKPHLLAVGHNNGMITIMDIVQEKVLQKLKSHSMEISCLSWSPNEPDVLLSVGLDFSIRIWKMGEDKPKNTYYIPTGRMKPEDKKKTKVVGICHPHKPNVVICTNSWGDLGEVTLFEDEKPKFTSYGVPGNESNCKFSIALFTDVVKTDQGVKDILYCFDSYKLSIWNLCEKKFVSQIPFLMGYVYDLSSSPKDPNFMAISNGDGILRVANLQGESKVDMSSVFVHFKTKILTTSWHPTLGNIIAYGTDEGRVGIIDTYKKKTMYSFETYHKDKVYRVCWGPCKKVQEDGADAIEYFIYSCGGGTIYINRLECPKEQGLKFDDLSSRPPDLDCADKNQSEICWNSDFSYVCIGNYKGFVDVYDGELNFLTRYTAEIKSVECLCWHPEMTYASPLGSPLKCWLACSGNDVDIYIFDTTRILEKKSSEEKKETSSEWALRKLVGHKKRVYSICWSQHNDGHLVSASKDGSALVWNACTGSVIASYWGHREVILAVHWSMFNPDVIYSGGHDSCVRIWKISEQGVTAPSERGVVRRRMKKPKQICSKKGENGKDSENEITTIDDEENHGNSEKSLNEGNNIKTCEAAKIKEDNKEDLSTSNEERGDTIQLASDIRPFKMTASSLGRKSTKLFSSLATDNNARNYQSAPSNLKIEGHLKDCMRLADILCKGASTQLEEIKISDNVEPPENTFTDEEILKLGLYTNQTTALRMIELQADYHLAKVPVDNKSLTTLCVMSGNLQTMLKEAAERGHLTSYHVSLAPSVSHPFWLEMCEKYAIQLVQEHQPYPASAYFLMCNKIYEAINIVADKGNIVDALVLAKARLPESDPLIPHLIYMVRKKFLSSGDIAGEANCFLALNEPLQAAKAISSGMDPNCARVAGYICKRYKLDNEADKYIFLSMERCLAQRDWASFKLLLNQEPHMQVYSALFAVHETFIHHVRNLKKKDGISVEEMFSHQDSAESVKIWTGNTCIDSKLSFTEHVYRILSSQNLLPAEKPALERVLEGLEILSTKRRSFDTACDAHIAIAIHITKFIFLSLMEDFEMAAASFLKIFESSYNVVFLPRIVCLLFLPMNLLWSDDTKSIICKDITCSDEESDTNNVVSNFQSIYQSICERIASFRHNPIDFSLVSKDGLHSNLNLITDQIGDILFAKEVSEYLLAYFVSTTINDLVRLIGKKDFKLECCAGKSSGSELEETVVEDVLDGRTKTDIPSESNSANESSESENTINTKQALQDLIDSVIKEAEDKAKSLIELETSTISVSTSDNNSSFQIIENPNQTSPECTIAINQSTEVSNLSVNPVTNEAEACLKQDNEKSKDESYSKGFAKNLTYVENDIDSRKISSNIISHAQCLTKIELFYNVVSLIVSNICKEEFALLYYLKEHLKHLTHTRASILLSKFSKESKVESDKPQPFPEGNGTPMANKAKIQDNVESSEIIQNKETANGIPSTKSLKTELCDGSVGENSLSIESVHVTPMMEQSANIAPETKNQCNGASMLTSISSNENYITTTNNIRNDESLIDQQNNKSTNEVQNGGTDKTEVNVLDCSSGENIIFSNLMIKQSAHHTSNTKNHHSITDALLEKTSECELSTIIYNDHNYSSLDKDPSASKEKTSSASRTSDNSLASLNYISFENLQQELTEISKLISHLELKSKRASYPSPFEVIPKILHVLHDVRRKSSCSVVQEKLHKFIDEIVCWSQMFSVAEINFVCEICHVASGV